MMWRTVPGRASRRDRWCFGQVFAKAIDGAEDGVARGAGTRAAGQRRGATANVVSSCRSAGSKSVVGRPLRGRRVFVGRVEARRPRERPAARRPEPRRPRPRRARQDDDPHVTSRAPELLPPRRDVAVAWCAVPILAEFVGAAQERQRRVSVAKGERCEVLRSPRRKRRASMSSASQRLRRTEAVSTSARSGSETSGSFTTSSRGLHRLRRLPRRWRGPRRRARSLLAPLPIEVRYRAAKTYAATTTRGDPLRT